MAARVETIAVRSSRLDKNRNCRREAARCFKSLNISLSHSRISLLNGIGN